MRNPLLVLLAAVSAAATLAIPAWSASTPPQLKSFSVSTVHRATRGLNLAVTGAINCTAKAHFHIWVWVYQSSRGALFHGLVPPTTCTGSVQRWSVKGRAEGKHPATFAAGPAQVCTVEAANHSRRYILRSSCSTITLA
jgi:hypothetical protein